MPVRWNAADVADGLDIIESWIKDMETPVETAHKVALEVSRIPNLPEYMGERIRGLLYELEHATSRLNSRIESIRKAIPAEAIKAGRELQKQGNQQALQF